MANNRRQAGNQSVNQGIANSWSFIAFVKAHGKKVQIADFVNSNTGEEFSTIVLTNDDGDRTLVNFSSNLGELSGKELKERKSELQVVQLESGTYKLCEQGQNSWEDVDLGI